MAAKKEDCNSSKSGIGPWGPTQSWAVVWFCAALLIGSSLTFLFNSVDFFMYSTNAQVLDFDKYAENRKSFTSLTTDSLDSRSKGSFGAAK